MHRPENPFRPAGLIWASVVAVVIGGVVLTSKEGKPTVDTATVQATSTVAQAQTTRFVLFAVPAPGAQSDKLFRVQWPDGKPETVDVAPGWRMTELGRASLTLQSVKSNDDAFELIGPDQWNVMLRTSSGKPFTEPTIIGQWDDTHAALTARNEDRLFLSVSRAGDIRELAGVPENANVLGFSEHRAWYATFLPGEGIESPPQGPSHLVRVSADGVTSTVATDDHVIVSVVASTNTAVAYGLDNGDLVVQPEGWRSVGRPLAWLDDQTLLFAKGVSIMEFQRKDGSVRPRVSLPGEPRKAVIEVR